MMWRAVLGRDWRIFIREFAAATALTTFLALLCVLIVWSAKEKGEESTFVPARVALVDEEGGSLSRIAINLISGQEFVSSVLSIEVVSEEEAMDGIDQGIWAAVVTLPKGYYTDICYGNPTVSSIILCKDEPVYTEVLKLLSDLGEKLVAAGQYGILAGRQALQEAGEPDFFDKYYAEINKAYMAEALTTKSKYFINADVGYEGSSLTLVSYYSLVYLAFISELCTLFFTKLVTRDATKPILSRYKSYGVSEGEFFSGKVLFPFLFRMLLLFTASLVLYRFFDISITPGACLTAAIGMLFISVLGGAVLIMFSRYEAGLVIISASAVIGLSLKGGAVPLAMFPEALKTFGYYTPLGIVFSCLSSLFGGSVSIPQWIVMALTLAVCLPAVKFHLRAVLMGKGEAE